MYSLKLDNLFYIRENSFLHRKNYKQNVYGGIHSQIHKQKIEQNVLKRKMPSLVNQICQNQKVGEKTTKFDISL